MSSRTSRAPLRTYSKRKQPNDADVNDILKRRRVEPTHDEAEPAPSSDFPLSDIALCSDENLPPSTPPSSPPCLKASPARGFRNSQDVNVVVETVAPKVQKRLVQMQLNFGQVTRRKCRDCGMEYVPSATEDAALHKKFHAQHINGLVLDKDMLRKANTDRIVWRGRDGAFIMALYGSQDMKPWSKKARAIFDMATSDLGAVHISDEELWGLGRRKDTRQRKVSTEVEPPDDRYRMYLYVDGSRCAGLCLAESIKKAYRVVEPKAAKEEDTNEQTDKEQGSGAIQSDKPLVISEEAEEAVVGISRIWTSKAARKKGIATALLNCVERTFANGGRTSRDLVAFSQPTELGTSLARRWFGKHSGWMVYVD